MLKKIVLTLALIAFSFINAEAAKGAKQISGVVNINTATLTELQMLPGIGKGKATAIISYRQSQLFKSPQELTKVKGIGDKMLAKLAPYVVIEGATTAKVIKSTGSSAKAPQPAELAEPATTSFFGF